MRCWAVLVGQSWLWWLLVAQVLGVALLVALGVGYVLGAARGVDRQGDHQSGGEADGRV